jgi:hypothetical protein
MKIYHLLYLSSQSAQMTLNGLQQILDISVQNNKVKAVTGMLIYRSPHFLQCLEGDEAIVTALYSKIEKDSRHTKVKKILNFTDSERMFPLWNMGSVNNENDQRQLIDFVKSLGGNHESLGMTPKADAVTIFKSFTKRFSLS